MNLMFFQRWSARTVTTMATLMLGTFVFACVDQNQSPKKSDAKPHAGKAWKVAASWPNWMGPNRDGISQETDWKTDWPEKGLPVLWSKEIGIGFSSIAIHGNRLFTMGHDNGEEIVWCLDATTGAKIWTFRYPCALINNLHEGGPGSTPTVHDGRVYTLGKEGQLHCLNATNGDVKWKKDLQTDLGVPLPEWGFSSSAVIHKNMVLLEGGRVVAYDKTTGKKLWQSAKHEAGYGSAAVFEFKKRDCIATLDCDALRVLDAANGKELASRQWQSPFRTNSTTPIVQGNKIFISTGYQIGSGLFEFDGTSLAEVYTNRNMRNHFNNSILYKGHLYGFDGNSNLGRIVRLTCLDFSTGEIKWQERGLGCGSLMIADGKLILLGESGTLALAKATPESYQEISRSKFLEGRCWTVPVLCGKRIYGRNATGKIVCVDVAQ